jgi:hypothetical protein
MLVLDVLLIYISILVFGNPFVDSILESLAILIATAAGAAIGIRAVNLPWRLTAPAALLAGIGLIVIGRFELPILEFDQLISSLWTEIDSAKVLDPRAGAIFLVICGAGIFLLPLFDPFVRTAGTAPTLWKVVLVAISLALLAMLADYLLSGGYMFGLLTLIFGSISSAVLVGAGLILALANLPQIGAWAGGLGLLLQAFVSLTWWLLGTPWFP